MATVRRKGQGEGPEGAHLRRRKHPGIRGRRPDMKYLRKQEAVARHVAYAKLSPKQRLERLPPSGARRERARLEALIATKQPKEKRS